MSASQNLSTAASAPRVHTEGQRQVAPAGNPDGARPRDPDGDSVDFGADLRSRFRGLLLWVPRSAPFRPGRSAHQALGEIRGHLQRGYQAVYDADLKGYFDSIPHDQLLACVRMRVVDRSVLKLIRMWLETPVVDPGDAGGDG